MYYIEKMYLTHQQAKWELIESSWEFTNPTDSQEYACKVAKTLALRFNGDSQVRVVCDEEEYIIATYLVTKRLIVSTFDGIFTEEIGSGLQVTTVSEIKK